MSRFFSKLGTHIQSAALQASSIDSRNDVIATGVVLLGCAAEFLFSIRIDGYMGIAVSIFILYSLLSLYYWLLSVFIRFDIARKNFLKK